MQSPERRGYQSMAVVRSALEDIAQRHGGLLRPMDVLNEARPEGSVLHKYFTWNDGAAAEAFRLVEAGQLIRSVRIQIQAGDQSERKVMVVRALQSTAEQRRNGGGYRKIEDILADPVQRAAMVQTALKELLALQNRYEMLSELAGVWDAIAAVRT